MRHFYSWFLLIVVLTALGVVGWQLRPSEEHRIRKVLLGMASDMTFTGGEGNIAKVAKIQSLVKHLTEDAEIHADQVIQVDAALRGRESIREVLTAGMSLIGAVSVQVHDLTIQLLDDNTAKAVLTASAKAGKRGEFDAQEFEVRLVRVKGQWLVSRVDAILGYRKPVIR